MRFEYTDVVNEEVIARTKRFLSVFWFATFFLSFLEVGLEEILPRYIFFVVEGYDVFQRDF